MQIPKRVLVGSRNGKRVINRPIVLLLGLLVGVIAGASAAGIWFLLTKQFSLSAVLVAVPLFVGVFLGTAIRRAFSVPLEQLPVLD